MCPNYKFGYIRLLPFDKAGYLVLKGGDTGSIMYKMHKNYFIYLIVFLRKH